MMNILQDHERLFSPVVRINGLTCLDVVCSCYGPLCKVTEALLGCC